MIEQNPLVKQFAGFNRPVQIGYVADHITALENEIRPYLLSENSHPEENIPANVLSLFADGEAPEVLAIDINRVHGAGAPVAAFSRILLVEQGSRAISTGEVQSLAVRGPLDAIGHFFRAACETFGLGTIRLRQE